MTKTCDARQDLIRRLGPPERLRAFIRDVDVAPDGRLQFPGAAVDATPKLFLGEGGEPALYEVIQEPLVGVKWTWTRGCRTSHR